MCNLLTITHQGRSGTIIRRQVHVAQLILASIILFPVAVEAQGTARHELRLGIGTFLSRDRGWNYGEPVELFAAVVRKSGSIDLEVGASFSKSFVRFSKPAVYPAPPSGYVDGFRARVGLRAPTVARSIVSALVGAELVHNRTQGEVRGTTVAASGGVGLSFGPARRGTLDLRYVRFAKLLGSSRGILPLTLAWRL